MERTPKAPSAQPAEGAQPAKSSKPAKSSRPTKPAKPAKADKPRSKLVRDSFTMPPEDFALIGELKAKAVAFQRPTKKSELLRAGLQALAALSPAALQKALGRLTPLKAGRPKKNG